MLHITLLILSISAVHTALYSAEQGSVDETYLRPLQRTTSSEKIALRESEQNSQSSLLSKLSEAEMDTIRLITKDVYHGAVLSDGDPYKICHKKSDWATKGIFTARRLERSPSGNNLYPTATSRKTITQEEFIQGSQTARAFHYKKEQYRVAVPHGWLRTTRLKTFISDGNAKNSFYSYHVNPNKEYLKTDPSESTFRSMQKVYLNSLGYRTSRIVKNS